jgi:hypothetical protein
MGRPSKAPRLADLVPVELGTAYADAVRADLVQWGARLGLELRGPEGAEGSELARIVADVVRYAQGGEWMGHDGERAARAVQHTVGVVLERWRFLASGEAGAVWCGLEGARIRSALELGGSVAAGELATLASCSRRTVEQAAAGGDLDAARGGGFHASEARGWLAERAGLRPLLVTRLRASGVPFRYQCGGGACWVWVAPVGLLVERLAELEDWTPATDGSGYTTPRREVR